MRSGRLWITVLFLIASLTATFVSHFTERGATHAVPVIRALPSDDGAASLAMILVYHGHPVTVDELRSSVNDTAGLSNGLKIVQTARRYGLAARGVKLNDGEPFSDLPPVSILHWEGNHFVVLEGFIGTDVVIIDPSEGRKRLTQAETLAHFPTRVALLFE
jgi:ABC-type bacteriocin/lantibiotic exporter with double-glycine peptidase domain